MSLFDFFFPDQAQAMHLRTIAENSRADALQLRSQQIAEANERRREHRLNLKSEDRVAALEGELAQSALVIESLITLLEEKQVLSREELQQRIQLIDAADGVTDGRITPPEKKPFTPKRDWPG